MVIQEHVSLKPYNTFGVEASARWLVEISEAGELRELFSDSRWHAVERLVLGGGSNLLFTRDFDGLVIRMDIPGITQMDQGESVLVTAGAGVVWNDLVSYCVDRNLAGIENLTLIPGSVGASPIQNIGAYGVEIKDVFESCTALEIATGQLRTFTHADCKFGYRESVFKGELKGQYIICDVTYRLAKEAHLQISYGAITAELAHRGIERPGIKDISEVVAHIRVSKLPDPSTIGNAGSFFKNPVVEVAKFRQLQSVFPDIVHFPASPGMEKLAAGWLLENAGWKGRTEGRAGTWKNQALVLVNAGNASGSDIYNLSSRIIADIQSRFGVLLEREVNII